jgi:hypothetical protein
MPFALNQPDGLHISTSATLAQLGEDEALRTFAAGLLHAALRQTCNLLSSTCASLTLAQALHHPGPETYPLLTALLALDAEVRAILGDETRVLPLPGFLSYRASLPLDKVPLQAVRLPPLNLGGIYRFIDFAGGGFAALRFDLHPKLQVVGHVRLVVGSPERFPVRLRVAEEGLDRRILTETLLDQAISLGAEEVSPPLTPTERDELIETCQTLWDEAMANNP